jgi:hypothetical protein
MANDLIKKLGALCYFVGCSQYIPASFYLGIASKYKISIILYISASAFLVLGAIIDIIISQSTKPKVGIDNLLNDFKAPVSKKEYNSWLLTFISSILKLFGGLLFLTGSILYLPQIAAETSFYGTWLFRIGSCTYTTSSVILIYNLLSVPSDKSCCSLTMLYLLAIIQYILGSICFFIGGIFSELKMSYVVEMWLMGSFLFTGGATVKLLLTIFK